MLAVTTFARGREARHNDIGAKSADRPYDIPKDGVAVPHGQVDVLPLPRDHTSQWRPPPHEVVGHRLEVSGTVGGRFATMLLDVAGASSFLAMVFAMVNSCAIMSACRRATA